MTKEEACLSGFRIIQTSGLARNELYAALEAAGSGNYSKAQKLIDKANELIMRSQNIQDAFLESASRHKKKTFQTVLDQGMYSLESTKVFRDYVIDLTRCPSMLQQLPAIYHSYQIH